MAEADSPGLATKLRDTRNAYARAIASVEEIGRDHLETHADALTRIDRVLDRYEERATGSGDFGAYLAFRQSIDAIVEELPEDLPRRTAFEEAAAAVDKRRLRQRDIDALRASVADIRTLVERIDDETAAKEQYEQVRREARARIATIDDRIAEIDRIRELADVDLDAPVGAIRDPIDRYNDAVHEGFRAYLDDTPAADVLGLFDMGDRFPLVPLEAPPDRLVAYLADLDESVTVPELLAYAEYSRSKLSHFVDDPDALVTAVSTDRTYLERLSAGPFTVDWPPPEADILAWRLRELVGLVDRFASDETVAHLRALQAVVREGERFNRLRDVAIARDRIDPDQRDRLRSGALAEERERLVRYREDLQAELDAAPD